MKNWSTLNQSCTAILPIMRSHLNSTWLGGCGVSWAVSTASNLLLSFGTISLRASSTLKQALAVLVLFATMMNSTCVLLKMTHSSISSSFQLPWLVLFAKISWTQIFPPVWVFSWATKSQQTHWLLLKRPKKWGMHISTPCPTLKI